VASTPLHCHRMAVFLCMISWEVCHRCREFVSYRHPLAMINFWGSGVSKHPRYDRLKNTYRVGQTAVNNFLLVDQSTQDYIAHIADVLTHNPTVANILFLSGIICEKVAKSLNREIAKFKLKILGAKILGECPVLHRTPCVKFGGGTI